MTRTRAAAAAVLGVLIVATGAGASAAGDERAVVQLLSRATFGPRPGDVARVGQLGVVAWLEAQLHPERIDDAACEAALQSLATLRLSIPELLRELHGERHAGRWPRMATAAPITDMRPPCWSSAAGCGAARSTGSGRDLRASSGSRAVISPSPPISARSSQRWRGDTSASRSRRLSFRAGETRPLRSDSSPDLMP